MRLIPHIQYDVVKFSRSSVKVVSNDTVVLVLLLFYFKDSMDKDCRIYKSTRGNKEMLLIHKVCYNLGNVLIKAPDLMT